MNELRLRFPQHDQADLALGAGIHGLARRGDAIVADAGADAPVKLCVDRRGVWMTLEQDAHAVHVNGRPVRRLAMLRVGDAIHLDGMLVQLLAANDVSRRIPEARAAEARTTGAGEPRLVLRGVGGQHHGRCFDLGRPRVVGRLEDSDIRIDAPAFADRHARLEPHGNAVALRALAPDDTSVVNGEAVRDAMLGPGDQVVFDAHHRFVVEAPGRPPPRDAGPGELEPRDAPGAMPVPGNARRMPWLLLAALLLAAGLAALLLFGAV
ncbi:MAG TPA: FHA domain-containing protein [Xanthomonadaceae bacterium]|nr:FHA domain-containing protein [Xanthomonadaceae bacterium]